MFTSFLQLMRFAMSSPKLITPGSGASPKPLAKSAGASRAAGKTVNVPPPSSKAPASHDRTAVPEDRPERQERRSRTSPSPPPSRRGRRRKVSRRRGRTQDRSGRRGRACGADTSRRQSRACVAAHAGAQWPALGAACADHGAFDGAVGGFQRRQVELHHASASAASIAAAARATIKKNPKLADNWKSVAADKLSDEEVLAMPDSEYMNDKQTAFFRLKLVRLKTDMLSNAGETTEHLREDTVVVPDPADRATIEEEHALELRTRDRERKLLKKIEQSIARIDAGDYGYCDETGEPIGVGRLLARPTATLSLEAQQRRELKQKMFGD